MVANRAEDKLSTGKFSRENLQENFRARTREMFGYTGVSNKGGEVDLESGETLYPGLSYGENQLRWGFIRKVYGILAAQIVLTTIVSSVTVLYAPINDLLRGNSGLLLFLCFLPLFCKSYHFRIVVERSWFIDLLIVSEFSFYDFSVDQFYLVVFSCFLWWLGSELAVWNERLISGCFRLLRLASIFFFFKIVNLVSDWW